MVLHLRALWVLGMMSMIWMTVEASTTDDDFIKPCMKYFYKDQKPEGFNQTKHICQRYEGKYYYATLYDIANRIPIYSAYRVDDLSCSGSQPSRRDVWFVEPELAGRDQQADMDTDKKSTLDRVAPVQAINDDYKDTGFDRGHLNPNFLHCNKSRTATFTLTNSVPQDSCFNRIVWYDWESDMKSALTSKCSFSKAERFVITGTVPSADHFIPQKDVVIEDIPDRGVERVNVPSHMWSAVCCDASESKDPNARSNFMGVIGENRAGGDFTRFSDYGLMIDRLSQIYGSNITLFADNCTSAFITEDVFG